MDDLIKKISTSTLSGSMIDPMVVSGIGVKDIHHYREKFTSIVISTQTDPETIKLLMQLLMSVKNRKRVLDGIKLSSTLQNDNEMKKVSSFLEKNCSESTRNQTDSKMPAVKIPDSFPDICSILFVTTCCLKGSSDPKKIFDELITKAWFSSIALAVSEQDLNKAAVKKMWDSWGTSAGVKKNNSGEVLKFDEEIYSNSEADKISLIQPNGLPLTIPTAGYTESDILKWISSWVSEASGKSVTYIGSKAVKTIQP